MRTLAERLAHVRTECGITQAALARAAGVNQSVIGGLETGYRKTSAYIPVIAAVLGVSALWLAEGRGPKHPSVGADLAHGTIDSADVIDSGNPRKPLFLQRQIAATLLHDLPILTREDIMEGKHQEARALIGERPTIKVAAGEHSPNSFGFEITDNAMAGGAQPLLPGWIAIVDPAEPKLNDDVVLVCGADKQPVIRQYMVDGPRHFVQTTGIHLAPREINPDDIIGVVVGHYYIRQRKR